MGKCPTKVRNQAYSKSLEIQYSISIKSCKFIPLVFNKVHNLLSYIIQGTIILRAIHTRDISHDTFYRNSAGYLNLAIFRRSHVTSD